MIGVDSEYPQRVVVSIRRGETLIIPGTVDTSRYVEDNKPGAGWDLAVEHQIEGAWIPNIRALLGKWTEVNGIQTQIIRSRDRDQRRDTAERNLVLRLERTSAGPATAPATARTVENRRYPTQSEAAYDEHRDSSRTATQSQAEPGKRVQTTSGSTAESN